MVLCKTPRERPDMIALEISGTSTTPRTDRRWRLIQRVRSVGIVTDPQRDDLSIPSAIYNGHGRRAAAGVHVFTYLGSTSTYKKL